MDQQTTTCDQAWVGEELRTVDLGDKRLNKRMANVLENIASRPTVSIPAACNGDAAETMAAYRFFDNQATTPESVLAPHYQATLQRIAAQPVVLLPQDTTEFDFTSKQDKIEGLGFLNDESRRGVFAHPVLAVTPASVCLGVVAVQWWTRTELGHRGKHKDQAFADKESVCWREGYQQACAVAEAAPQTRIVSISDREGDIFECFVAALPEQGRRKASWIIRAQHDRAVTVDEGQGPLWERVARTAVLGTLIVKLPATAKRKARKAKLTVQAAAIQPRIPYRPDGKLPAVKFSAVLVREVDAPADGEPIEWMLLTDLPTATFAEASVVVEYYCCRWHIEVFFRVLKTGCKVEERQLEHTDRLLPCLTMYMIVAWRILYVTWMGRAYPTLSCEVLFAPEEWKSVWAVVKKKPAPQEPPSLTKFLAMVASLGGHLGRKHDGEPGTQTMWIGMQRMHDFALAWLSFGPEKNK